MTLHQFVLELWCALYGAHPYIMGAFLLYLIAKVFGRERK